MMKSDEPCEIQIDKQGTWYYHGAEMIRQDIVQYFYQHLKTDKEGSFYIEINEEKCKVRVDDVPYVIKSVDIIPSLNDGKPSFMVTLSDGNTEIINLDKPLRMRRDNVLYCTIRNGEFEARFSRPAYYQLCKYIEYDSEKEAYTVNIDHCTLPIDFDENMNGGSDA